MTMLTRTITRTMMMINCNDFGIDRDENYNIKDDDNGNDRERCLLSF